MEEGKRNLVFGIRENEEGKGKNKKQKTKKRKTKNEKRKSFTEFLRRKT
jgi:hypothetical protein